MTDMIGRRLRPPAAIFFVLAVLGPALIGSEVRAQTVERSLAQAASLEAQGRLDEAAEVLDRLSEVWPEDYAVRLYAGWIALQRERYDEAADHYRAAVELSEGNPQALLGLARARSGARQYRLALEPAERAAEALPDTARAHLELGWISYNLERYTEALQSYRHVLELEPSNADARAGLGWALVRLGREGEARREFARALELSPEHPSAVAGREATRRDLTLDAGVRGLVFVGSKIPSTAWGGGVATSLALRAGSFRPRLAYRYSQLQPPERPRSPGQPAYTPEATDNHFAAAGLDFTHRWFEAGVLGGYAASPELDWSAGVIALHLGARIWAELDLVGVLILSDEDPLGQVSLTATAPIHRNVDLWAAFLLSIQGEDLWPAGLGGIRVHGRSWSVDVFGRYGTTSSQLVYAAPALYDFVEELDWSAGAIGSIPIAGSADLGVDMEVGFEVSGTDTTMPDGTEVEGVISMMHLGFRFIWGREAEDRRRPCDER